MGAFEHTRTSSHSHEYQLTYILALTYIQPYDEWSRSSISTAYVRRTTYVPTHSFYHLRGISKASYIYGIGGLGISWAYVYTHIHTRTMFGDTRRECSSDRPMDIHQWLIDRIHIYTSSVELQGWVVK